MKFTKKYLMCKHCDWLHIANFEMGRKGRMREDQFVSLFGLSSTTIHRIHFVYLMETTLWRPKYIVWAFNFMKTYNVRRSAYTSFKDCSENVFRIKVWMVIALLYTDMNEVSIFFILCIFFKIYFKVETNLENQTHPVIVIDATECVISRPKISTLANIVYSGYKKKHTVKYEVAVSEINGAPLSVMGPVAGPTSDMNIYRMRVRKILKEKGWLGLADGTYQGDYKYLVVPPRPYYNLTEKKKDFTGACQREGLLWRTFLQELKTSDV